MAKVLIAGCGDVGSALGERLLGAGHTVRGLRRQADALPPGILPLQADLERPPGTVGDAGWAGGRGLHGGGFGFH